MVHKHDVLGRIYTFKPKSTYSSLNLSDEEITAIPSHIRSEGRMVLVLDTVKGRKGYVKVMAITRTTTTPGTYLPISPTPKKPYPIQVGLRNNSDGQSFVLTRLPGKGQKYLRVDENFEVPITVLEGVKDALGDEVVVPPRKMGGMGELGEWLRGWERRREGVGGEEEREWEVLEKVEEKEEKEEERVEKDDAEPGEVVKREESKEDVFRRYVYMIWMMVQGLIQWVWESLCGEY